MNAEKKRNFIVHTIDKEEEIESIDLLRISSIIEYFREQPSKFHNSLHLIFDGYNDDPREIYEIKEIRVWVEKLVYTYPDVLYYLEDEQNGLNNVLLCLSNFDSIKGIPGAEYNPLNNLVYVKACIPSDIIESISLQLVINPFLLMNEEITRKSLVRLLSLSKNGK